MPKYRKSVLGFDCNEKGILSPAISHLPVNKDVGILIQNVSARWTEDGPLTLNNLNITIPKGSLCAIIGAVGSGKVMNFYGTYTQRCK